MDVIIILDSIKALTNYLSPIINCENKYIYYVVIYQLILLDKLN